MLSIIKEILKEWNKKDRLSKLQDIYFVVGVILLILAGLSSLVNYGIGLTLLEWAKLCAMVLFANFITWILVDGVICKRIPTVTKTVEKVKTARKRSVKTK